MSDLASVSAIVYGRVQGVFFRAFVLGHARELGVTGYVRNLPDRTSVEVRAEGERERLQGLLKHLETGPPGARVKRVEVNWSDYGASFHRFEIRY